MQAHALEVPSGGLQVSDSEADAYVVLLFDERLDELGWSPGGVPSGPCGAEILETPFAELARRTLVGEGLEAPTPGVVPGWAQQHVVALGDSACLCPDWRRALLIEAEGNALFRIPISLGDGHWLALQSGTAEGTALWRIEENAGEPPTPTRIGAVAGFMMSGARVGDDVVLGGHLSREAAIHVISYDSIMGQAAFLATDPEPILDAQTSSCSDEVVRAIVPFGDAVRAVLGCGDVWERGSDSAWRRLQESTEIRSECAQPTPELRPARVRFSGARAERLTVGMDFSPTGQEMRVASVVESGLRYDCMSPELLPQGEANVELDGAFLERDGTLGFCVTFDSLATFLIRRFEDRWVGVQEVPLTVRSGGMMKWFGREGLVWAARDGLVGYSYVDGFNCQSILIGEVADINVLWPIDRGFLAGTRELRWALATRPW